MSILLKSKIQEEIESGNIIIDPYNPDHINPNSIDLTLADELYRYKENSLHGFMFNVLEAKEENPVRKVEKDSETGGYFLEPGIGYLARTNERTFTKKYVPMVEGRSSYGRLFLSVHATAGFGDIGFDGYWTLELSVVQPLVIYPGSRICQIFFNTVEGEIKEEDLYTGKYQSNTEVQASMSYKDR